MKMSAITTTTPVSGLKLLEACNFNRHICASIIATRDDWPELLNSIPSGPSRKNVAVVVAEIREALGQDSGYARQIAARRAAWLDLRLLVPV